MPFYEYECSSCKFYTEVMQKITDAPLRKCPSCGRNTLVKLVSAPIFRLKGSGWYETDFKSDKENKRNLATSETEPPSDTKSGESSSTTKGSESGGDEGGAGKSSRSRSASVTRRHAATAARKPVSGASRTRKATKARSTARRGRAKARR